MRRVAPDASYIDYIYDHAKDDRWGVRVRPERCQALCSGGNDLDQLVVVQQPIPIPVKAWWEDGASGVDTIPRLFIIQQEYMGRYPWSDLHEVMSGATKFADALKDAREH
jgi:hypothetical protein